MKKVTGEAVEYKDETYCRLLQTDFRDILTLPNLRTTLFGELIPKIGIPRNGMQRENFRKLLYFKMFAGYPLPKSFNDITVTPRKISDRAKESLEAISSISIRGDRVNVLEYHKNGTIPFVRTCGLGVDLCPKDKTAGNYLIIKRKFISFGLVVTTGNPDSITEIGKMIVEVSSNLGIRIPYLSLLPKNGSESQINITVFFDWSNLEKVFDVMYAVTEKFRWNLKVYTDAFLPVFNGACYVNFHENGSLRSLDVMEIMFDSFEWSLNHLKKEKPEICKHKGLRRSMPQKFYTLSEDVKLPKKVWTDPAYLEVLNHMIDHYMDALGLDTVNRSILTKEEISEVKEALEL